MAQTNIHPTAIIEDGAEIGNNVSIEAYAIVKANVKLRDNVTIKSHAYIDGNTTVGEGTVIWPFASIGTKTQDLKFRGEKTFVEIGKNCDIREFVTVNASCEEGSVVKIGDSCLVMAYCHVAHNCELKNNVIMANGAMLAGYVVVEEHAVIGGMTPIHQRSRVGKYAMVGGFSRVTHDIPPYTIGAGSPYKLGGLNLIGLKRHQFSLEERRGLSHAFKIVYRSGLGLQEALELVENTVPLTEHVTHFVHFCRSSKRGLIGFCPESSHIEEEDLLELEEAKI